MTDREFLYWLQGYLWGSGEADPEDHILSHLEKHLADHKDYDCWTTTAIVTDGCSAIAPSIESIEGPEVGKEALGKAIEALDRTKCSEEEHVQTTRVKTDLPTPTAEGCSEVGSIRSMGTWLPSW